MSSNRIKTLAVSYQFSTGVAFGLRLSDRHQYRVRHAKLRMKVTGDTGDIALAVIFRASTSILGSSMPYLQLSRDLEMYYVVDDFTDPWRKPETILLCHGNNESHRAWYGWVPHLARQYQVVRPDMRGFGDSTPMVRDFPWTLDVVINDYLKLIDHLGVQRFHLVGAKIGGVIGRAFAARHPDRVHTLTVVGSPPPIRADQATREARVKEVLEQGIEHWARRSMSARLGSKFPKEGIEWWIKYMGRTAVSTEAGFAATINFSDITADVANIKCPMLVLTTQESGLASVTETRAWQEKVPHSELIVLPGDSFHAAATDADACAQALLGFVTRHAM